MTKRTGLLIVGLAWLASNHLQADPEVAVAMRYFQDTGTSHGHIYIYREDGKLLRQLTNDNSAQDYDPFFSPDGNVIVFTRWKGDDKTIADGNNGKTFWSIGPRGVNLHQLASAPEWYLEAESQGLYGNSDSIGKPIPPSVTDCLTDADKIPHYKFPDGKGEVSLKLDEVNFKTILTITNGKLETVLNSPVHSYYTGALAWVDAAENKHFIFDGPMHCAFFCYHMNSTDGDTIEVVDLNDNSLHNIETPGCLSPIPLPGEAAFLSLSIFRYVNYGTQGKTDAEAYLERWDSKYKQTIYDPHPGAGRFYGASIYRGPSVKPAVMWIAM